MYEGNFVICDQEKEYARNLLQMFTRNRKIGIQMYLFHTMEELEKFAAQKTIKILLIDKAYPQKQRQMISAEEKFVLVKDMQDSLAENEKGIYRYQSAEAIWSQIQNGKPSTQIQKKRIVRKLKEGVRENSPQSIEESGNQRKVKKIQNVEDNGKKLKISNPEEIQDKNIHKILTDTVKQEKYPICQTGIIGNLIGVYSPIHRIGKTKFAMEMGKELAKKGPVLYLNMEEYAGGDYYFHDQTGQTLADLLYYARQEKDNFGLRISMMAGQDEELDYILPMPYVQDLQGVSVDEWMKLFDRILENCIYKVIILDLGDSISGLFQILEKCDTVYTPYIEDDAAHAKMNQYVENLRKTGKEKVLEKTIQKKMK